MRDIGPGCEGLYTAIETWIAAVSTSKVDVLHDLLTDDFVLSCDVSINGGRMEKDAFIEFDRHIEQAKIKLISLTARRYENIAITQAIATVDETFDANPSGASIEALAPMLSSGRLLAYASGWRTTGDGTWRCFQHHLFGPVE